MFAFHKGRECLNCMVIILSRRLCFVISCPVYDTECCIKCSFLSVFLAVKSWFLLLCPIICSSDRHSSFVSYDIQVKVTCECGHRSMSRACSDNAKEYQRIATSLLASKMADMQLGHSVDIRDLLGNPSTRKMSLKT